jgi:hypothetical protein
MFLVAKNPAIGALHAGPGSCDQLNAEGKPVIAVEYDVRGTPSTAFMGSEAVKIHGKAFEDLLQSGHGAALRTSSVSESRFHAETVQRLRPAGTRRFL